jgi:hypothetical protein
MGTPFKMRGFSGFGNSPVRQTEFPYSAGAKRLRVKNYNKLNENYLKSETDEEVEKNHKLLQEAFIENYVKNSKGADSGGSKVTNVEKSVEEDKELIAKIKEKFARKENNTGE